MQHSIFPGVAAVVITVLIKTCEYLLTVEQDGSLEEFVKTNWQYCLMTFVFGVSIALIVLTVVDQHIKLRAHATVLLSLFFCLPYMVWAVFVQSLSENPTTFLSEVSWRLREILLLVIPVLSFAVLFSILLEMSEESDE